MSYEPTNWKSGDVVTSQKLNKIEAGIAAGSVTLVRVNVTQSGNTITYALDKTYAEIEAAYAAGPIFCQLPPETEGGIQHWEMLINMGFDEVENEYVVSFPVTDMYLMTATKDDCPSKTKSSSSGPN